MKRRGNAARRLAFGRCGLVALVSLSALSAALSTAHAETAAPANANSPAPAAYQDRYIGGGSLVPDISTGDEATSDTQGLAYSLELDGVLSVLSSRGSGSDSNLMENGIIASHYLEFCNRNTDL